MGAWPASQATELQTWQACSSHTGGRLAEPAATMASSSSLPKPCQRRPGPHHTLAWLVHAFDGPDPHRPYPRPNSPSRETPPRHAAASPLRAAACRRRSRAARRWRRRPARCVPRHPGRVRDPRARTSRDRPPVAAGPPPCTMDHAPAGRRPWPQRVPATRRPRARHVRVIRRSRADHVTRGWRLVTYLCSRSPGPPSPAASYGREDGACGRRACSVACQRAQPRPGPDVSSRLSG